jgi:hypothetical protein
VSVLIVGGIFVHKGGGNRFGQKRTTALSEETMKRTELLTVEQEAQAQELAGRITEAIAADVLRIARLLVSKDTRHTFGQTELQLRDLLHHAGATALEISLAQKKTVTMAPA